MEFIGPFLQDQWPMISTGLLLIGGAILLLNRKKKVPIAQELTVYGLFDHNAFAGLPDLSPFVTKIETFLRHHKIDYVRKNVDLTTYSSRAETKGKVPFIEHKGKVISDSRLIIKYLRKEFHLPDSTVEEKALTHAYTQTLEHSLYWAITYEYFCIKENFQRSYKRLVKRFGRVKARFLKGYIIDGIKTQLYAQGHGRYTEKELWSVARDDLRSLSVQLGEKKYMFGDRLTFLDIEAFSFLAALFGNCDKHEKGLSAMDLSEFDNLKDYVTRLKALWWSDLTAGADVISNTLEG